MEPQHLKGQSMTASGVELWRVSEFRGGLALKIQLEQVRTQQQLVNTLLRLEHGEAAMALLLRLQDGLTKGPRRPVPCRRR